MIGSTPAVKTTAFLLTFLLLAVASATGQEQERKLMDRLLKPDLQKGNPFQSQSFNGTGSLSLRSSSSTNKKFSDTKDANIKSFSLTHSFFGLKNPWFGGQVYDTKNASLWSKSIVMNADKKVPVLKAELASASEPTKRRAISSAGVLNQTMVPRRAN